MTSLAVPTYVEETIALKKQIEGYFIHLAERLYNIREQRLWEGNYTSFVEFLKDIDLSESTSSKLILIYQTFVLEDGLRVDEIAGVSWTTLYEITRIDDVQARKEFVDNAGVLSRQDTKDAIREYKTGCTEHDNEPISMFRCKTCGKLTRDYGTEGSKMPYNDNKLQ